MNRRRFKEPINKLPKEYQEVEYLENTDASRIGFYPTFKNGDIISFKFEYMFSGRLNGTYASCIMGGYERSGYNIVSIICSSTSNPERLIYEIPNTTSRQNSGYNDVSGPNKKIIANLNSLDKNNYINDIEYENPKLIIRGGYNNVLTYLFTRTATLENFIGRLYYFEIIKNGKSYFNFIPCKRKSDNKPGMYDVLVTRY